MGIPLKNISLNYIFNIAFAKKQQFYFRLFKNWKNQDCIDEQHSIT